MSKKKSNNDGQISEQEKQFFLDEMTDVRPIVLEKRVEISKKQPPPRPLDSQFLQELDKPSDSDVFSDPVDIRDAKTEDTLFFARDGIQQKLQKKLRRGELPVEDVLDLHGYTVAEAKIAIQDFLYECKRQSIRYIQIIHGKGFRSEQNIPILKTHVAYWLPQHSHVLAFSSALPRDGGTGALYVLLKSCH